MNHAKKKRGVTVLMWGTARKEEGGIFCGQKK